MITLTDQSTEGKNMLMVGVVEGHITRTVNDTDFEHMDKKELMSYSREAATEQMIAEAEKIGADAIVCVRHSSAPVGKGTVEVAAYGTAVKFK